MTGNLLVTWSGPNGGQTRTVAGVDADGRVLLFDGLRVVAAAEVVPVGVCVRIVPAQLLDGIDRAVALRDSWGES